MSIAENANLGSGKCFVCRHCSKPEDDCVNAWFVFKQLRGDAKLSIPTPLVIACSSVHVSGPCRGYRTQRDQDIRQGNGPRFTKPGDVRRSGQRFIENFDLMQEMLRVEQLSG